MTEVVLNKKDFPHVDDVNFVINKENSVYFAPNGLGKTTIFKNYGSEFDFALSYAELQNDYVALKNSFEIGLNINTIDKLTKELETLLSDLQAKKMLKPLGITNKEKYVKYIDADAKGFPTEPVIVNKDEIIQNIINKIDEIEPSVLILAAKFLDIDYYNAKEELPIRNTIKHLETALNDFETDDKCPTCETIVDNLKQKIILTIEDLKNQCKEEFNSFFAYVDNEKIDLIKYEKLINQLKGVNKLDIKDFIIIGAPSVETFEIYKVHKNNYLTKKSELIELQTSIKKEFDTYIKKDFNSFQILLSNLFNVKLENIKLNDEKYTIHVDLDRKCDTYSTGELNIIMFYCEMIKLKSSKQESIIFDDPITSFDFVNKHNINFELIKIAQDNNAVVFTHELNVIETLKQQKPGSFKFYYLDIIENKIEKFKINLDKSTLIETLISSSIILENFKNDFQGSTRHYKVGQDIENELKQLSKGNNFIELMEYKVKKMTLLRKLVEQKILEIDPDIKIELLEYTIRNLANSCLYNKKSNLTSKLRGQKTLLNNAVHFEGNSAIPFSVALNLTCKQIDKIENDLHKIFNDYHALTSAQ